MLPNYKIKLKKCAVREFSRKKKTTLYIDYYLRNSLEQLIKDHLQIAANLFIDL